VYLFVVYLNFFCVFVCCIYLSQKKLRYTTNKYTEEVKIVIYNKQIHRRSSDIQQTNTQKKLRYTTNKYTEEVKIVIYNKQIHRRS
jgi:hypothetical protein